MKRLMLAAATVAVLSLRAAAQNDVGPEVIYGSDDRVDLYQVKSSKVLELADGTVALFEGGSVTFDGAKAKLATQNYGTDMQLCKEEPFYDQFNGAFCSGSLVAPDVIMTAGHCVTSQSACEGTKFVFGFAIKDPKVKNPNELPASEVYGCKTLIGREQVNDGADWALIRLDRPVAGHKPLAINRAGDPAKDTPLVVIGHPAGLPTKVAGGAKVRTPDKTGYFVANLDTYGGNSGSAVFNARTGLIEGILVRGENDYVWKGQCRVSNVCAADACRGEDVTKASSVIPHLPKRGRRSSEPELARVVEVSSQLSAYLEKLSDAPQSLNFDRP